MERRVGLLNDRRIHRIAGQIKLSGDKRDE
jgi:hypothetical protein